MFPAVHRILAYRERPISATVFYCLGMQQPHFSHPDPAKLIPLFVEILPVEAVARCCAMG